MGDESMSMTIGFDGVIPATFSERIGAAARGSWFAAEGLDGVSGGLSCGKILAESKELSISGRTNASSSLLNE